MRPDGIVAVTGATGRQGGAVARHLLAEGWRVRALTRRPDSEPARRLAALGAEVVHAEMANRNELTHAFRDVHGVFSVQNFQTSGLTAEVLQGRGVADAAKQAGVRHLVYGSAGIGRQTGIGSWDSKLAVEDHLRAIGVPCTILRPMAFMELMTDKRFFPAVACWYLMPKLMGPDRPVPWIAVDDLGAVASRVFRDADRYLGVELKLAADIQSIRQCAKVWQSVGGRRPRRAPMPEWLFKRFVGNDLLTMWRWLRTGHFDIEVAQTREILPAAKSVREWVILQQGTSRRTGHRPA